MSLVLMTRLQPRPFSGRDCSQPCRLVAQPHIALRAARHHFRPRSSSGAESNGEGFTDSDGFGSSLRKWRSSPASGGAGGCTLSWDAGSGYPNAHSCIHQGNIGRATQSQSLGPSFMRRDCGGAHCMSPSPAGSSNPQRKPQQHTGASSSKGSSPGSTESLSERLGTKLVLGNDMSEEAWRQIDKKLNKYPGFRTFTAIGTGGAEFRQAMILAVEAVLGPGAVHVECVSERPSSKGAYLSVRIGPVAVQNPDQVIQIFAQMKKDERLKWYM